MSSFARWSLVSSGLIACGRADAPAEDTDVGTSGIVVDASDASGRAVDDGTTADDGDDDDGPRPTKYDVGSPTGTLDCSDGEVTTAFSIIWIANSPEGTVSKIDTGSAVELARYRTGPDGPDPSRTAVNLAGDVAVSNRRGSITKIAGSLAGCVDADGDGEIRTSGGADDVLDWGEDECVLWHASTSFDASIAGSSGGPRATAWTGGTLDPDTCDVTGVDLWVSWRNQPESSATIRKISGVDGTTLGEAVIEDWPDNWGHGPYGGAADAAGDLWALGTSGSMFRVDGDDFGVERWDNGVSHVMYGIALDAAGDPWVAGYDGKLWHFDRTSAAWVDKGGTDGGPSRLRGLAVDPRGHAWVAGNGPCGLMRYDTIADELVDGHIDLPGCATPVGVSVDAEGMIWVVDRDAERAYRVDPDDYAVTTVEGLVQPYTYSDMTGAGLGLVVNPPG